jgi:PPOX class probable F420-dependent enzyme
VPRGSCDRLSELPAEQYGLLDTARRGSLSTIGSSGMPHTVPVVFVMLGDAIISPIDDKPKDGPELVRVRNLATVPNATLLVDHWDEDWRRLAWVMVQATARVESRNVGASSLRQRYPQYDENMTPGTRSIVLSPRRIIWWTWE